MDETKVLIVEDERLVAEHIRSSLDDLGFSVSGTVTSGEEAINRLKENNTDLVLMDVMLKGEMDGIEAAGHIRTRFNIPVVYLTAHADEEVLGRAKITEPFGYVIKPFKDKELKVGIEMALIKHKTEQALQDARDELELRVEERTAELTRANALLTQEIADRKRAEEHVHTLSQQLMKAHETERQMISRDLHDCLAQDLSALKIDLDTLFDNEPRVGSDTTLRISELSKRLQMAVVAVRNMALELGPTGLDQIGLIQTVRGHCQEFFAKNAVKVSFFATGIEDSKLDSDTRINLYRIVQEGLNNVKKHADASQSSVQMVGSFPNVILCIQDNGKGFDVQHQWAAAVDGTHMGLRGMKERVALLNGKIRIDSDPMRGTKIVVEVPFGGRR